MRRLGGPATGGCFGANAPNGEDWAGGTVLAGTGSLDMLLDLPLDEGAAISRALAEGGSAEPFWRVARDCAAQTTKWLDNGWARESLLLFGAGWEFMNMNRVVELGAQDRSTLGRAYSCGTSNAGVFAHSQSYGGLTLDSVHFGISQSVSAPAVSVSCLTVGGALCLSTQWCAPIWGDEQGRGYAVAVQRMLELVAQAGDEEKRNTETS